MDKQENFELNTSYVQVVDRYRETISDLKAIIKRLEAENERLENLYKFSDIANRAENEKRVQYEIALVEVREKGVVR